MRGITIIETLIVLGIIGILVGSGIPSLRMFISQTNAQDATMIYVQMLRRAQSLSTSGYNNSAWGVAIATSSVTLFKGTSFATRDTSFDELYTPSAELYVSGLSEVMFATYTGLPTAAGTTTIDTDNTLPKNILINEKGTITY